VGGTGATRLGHGDDELGRHTRFAGSYATGASALCWACPAPPRCATWKPVARVSRAWAATEVPWQSVTQWRQGLEAEAWTYLTVQDGEKGPVAIEMVKCRVQTRIERKRTGPAEWLVVTRRPLADAQAW